MPPRPVPLLARMFTTWCRLPAEPARLATLIAFLCTRSCTFHSSFSLSALPAYLALAPHACSLLCSSPALHAAPQPAGTTANTIIHPAYQLAEPLVCCLIRQTVARRCKQAWRQGKNGSGRLESAARLQACVLLLMGHCRPPCVDAPSNHANLAHLIDKSTKAGASSWNAGGLPRYAKRDANAARACSLAVSQRDQVFIQWPCAPLGRRRPPRHTHLHVKH